MPDRPTSALLPERFQGARRARIWALKIQRAMISFGLILLLAGAWQWKRGELGDIGHWIVAISCALATLWAWRRPIREITIPAENDKEKAVPDCNNQRPTD